MLSDHNPYKCLFFQGINTMEHSKWNSPHKNGTQHPNFFFTIFKIIVCQSTLFAKKRILEHSDWNLIIFFNKFIFDKKVILYL